MTESMWYPIEQVDHNRIGWFTMLRMGLLVLGGRILKTLSTECSILRGWVFMTLHMGFLLLMGGIFKTLSTEFLILRGWVFTTLPMGF